MIQNIGSSDSEVEDTTSLEDNQDESQEEEEVEDGVDAGLLEI